MLLGCVSTPSYPPAWSSLKVFDKCPNIEGYYIDEGESEEESDYKRSIFMDIIGGDYLRRDEVEFVNIIQKNNELLLEAYSDAELIGKRVAAFDTENCVDGFIEIEGPYPEGGVNRDGVVGYQWDSLKLAKTTDGSLILRKDSGAVGVVMVVPVAGTGWGWYRFLPHVRVKKVNSESQKNGVKENNVDRAQFWLRLEKVDN